MSRADRNALISFLAVIVVAALLAWAGSANASSGPVPVFAIVVGLAFVMQWLAFIPAFLKQTERYFDITGSATYITVVAVALLTSPIIDGRSLLLFTLVSIWAIRLGSFLFLRVRKAGKDGRFDDLKPSFIRFLLTWTLQGLWVSFTLAAALAAMTSSVGRELGWMTWIGVLIWCVGFAIEAIADSQKTRFRANPANRGSFIQIGLWSWSRHPNYFGEIVLWVGIAIIAVPVLQGWQWVTLISPVFVTVLLTRISGVPMLEKRSDAKWGGQADYESYKRRTSVLIPRSPKTEPR